jgi:hypothetical protein
MNGTDLLRQERGLMKCSSSAVFPLDVTALYSDSIFNFPNKKLFNLKLFYRRNSVKKLNGRFEFSSPFRHSYTRT